MASTVTSSSLSYTNPLSYRDLYYSGYFPPTGLPYVTGIEAIKNTIKMLLMSYLGDYGREVSKGGYLFSLLGKGMTANTATLIQTTITNIIQTNYTNIIVTSVNVTADGTTWNILVNFDDNLSKFSSSTNLSIKGIS